MHRLLLTSAEGPAPPNSVETYRPLLCIITSGQKRLLTAHRQFVFGAGDHFVNSHVRPVTGWIEQAPYRSMTLELDIALLSQVIPQQTGAAASISSRASLCRDPVTPSIIQSAVRLLSLLDSPGDLGTLWPLYEQELLYRVLQGPCGSALSNVVYGFGSSARIRPAISWIREHYDRPLRLEALAAQVQMSVASLRRHFHAATGYTPLQFQKMLRLQEARRLLLLGEHTSASAAHVVGYASPAQFNREYASHFGEPPIRDTAPTLV